RTGSHKLSTPNAPSKIGALFLCKGAAMIPNTTPVFAVDEKNLVPVSDHLKQLMDIPPSRMFLINKSLKVYQEKNPGAKIFDASQGDGGASLPGVPKAILERAAQIQIEHGTAYDMPFGTDGYRKSVIE